MAGALTQQVKGRIAGWHRVDAGPVVEGDNVFGQLLGVRAWTGLPSAIQHRFERKILAGATIVYAGEVAECRMSRAGRVLAQIARLIGGPLPLFTDAGVSAQVCVTGEAGGSAQYWTRTYARAQGFPQTIRSVKRFAGPTGLEEYLGCGFGIALRLQASADALHFHGDHYFLALGPVRLRLPRWLSPGRLVIGHIDGGAHMGRGRFAFTLDLTHPLFGELVHQVAIFEDEG